MVRLWRPPSLVERKTSPWLSSRGPSLATLPTILFRPFSRVMHARIVAGSAARQFPRHPLSRRSPLGGLRGARARRRVGCPFLGGDVAAWRPRRLVVALR